MRPHTAIAIVAIAIVLALAGSLMPSIGQTEQYPSRPVRILVGFAAGGAPDVLARTVATQLSNDLGQNFYIENRPGANGTIAIAVVVQSEPDGYTLLFSSSSIAPTPYVNKNPAFDILRDLLPIATAGIGEGYLLLVNPSTPVHTVSEFIAYAKSKRVLYGTPGVGNILHVVTELFRQQAGIAMDHIPYKGAAEVQTALLGKTIDVMFVAPPSVIATVQAGQLRAIGYTGVKPLAEFPDVPLIRDSLPGFSVPGSWAMVYAPSKTPGAIIERLNAAIRHALRVPTVAGVLSRAGYAPDSRSPAETADFFRRQVELAGEAVRAAGIAPN